ncbi:MAG: T9SS type A sorting domain-containing protein [Saprospiraceae bacterium]|nr:T9SS type A sorting domain-containing protein [Saprospiraceae bacterium]MCB0678340.1 T9SS type A sorting domain-containing protein [Saprospiraceae bacterium]
MKRLLLLLFVLFLAAPPTLLFAQCPAGTAQTDLSVNNVLARLKNSGDIWWDGNTGTYIIPKEEPDQTSALFAGAVWLGGIDGGGTLRMLSQTYGTGFGSGPLNPITGTTNPTDCNNWDKFFQTTSGSIQLHRDDYSPDGVIDGPIPTSIRGWPARGNQFFADIHGFELPDQDLAPFFDRNENGLYEPDLGDFPLVKGDQSIWWVYNDGGNDVGLEIQANAFAYTSDDAYIDNTTFYEYKFIYRGDTPLTDTYMALWVDPDLGCYLDDFIGCDPENLMAFVYNGDDFDEDCVGINGYESDIPMLGIKVIKPFMTPAGDSTDLAYFTYYFNGFDAPFPATADPAVDLDYYNYMTGRWLDGTPFSQGGIGYEPGQPGYPYAFDGSDVDGEPWTECTAGAVPGDRRLIMSFGPVTLNPGDVREFAFAVLWQPHQTYPCPDLSPLTTDGALAAQFFEDKCIEINTVVGTNEPISHKLVRLFPNPMRDEATLRIDLPPDEVQQVVLRAFNGQVLRILPGQSSNEYRIAREDLPDGMYFYEVRLKTGQRLSGKLVMQ